MRLGTTAMPREPSSLSILGIHSSRRPSARWCEPPPRRSPTTTMNNSILTSESRQAIAMACGLAIGAYGMADAQSLPAQSLQDRLRSCAAEADDARRLTCYDRLSATLPPTLPPTAAVAPTSVAQPASPASP